MWHAASTARRLLDLLRVRVERLRLKTRFNQNKSLKMSKSKIKIDFCISGFEAITLNFSKLTLVSLRAYYLREGLKTRSLIFWEDYNKKTEEYMRSKDIELITLALIAIQLVNKINLN